LSIADAPPPHADFVVLNDAIRDRINWLKSKEMPRKFFIGDGEFGHLHFGPGQLVVVGGVAGCGKSCLVAEWVFNAVAADPALRAIITNVDVGLEKFVERQLARVSGVDADVLHWKQYGEQEAVIQDRLDEAAAHLETVADRIAFLRGCQKTG